MKNTFFTVDTHFGHKKILNWCKRPFNSIEENDEVLVSNWNNTVKRGDTVYHIGDFAMYKANGLDDRMNAYRSIRGRLNGRIVLVLGNHDKMSRDMYKMFSEVYEFGRIIKVNRQRIVLCHYPLRTWEGKEDNVWHLFGHVHGRFEHLRNGMTFDVGVDVPEWGYSPVSFEKIKAKMKIKYEEFKEYKMSRNNSK